MAEDLSRISLAIPTDLLQGLDELTERRGIQKNRSEVIRDLIRDALVDETVADPDAEVMGTLTIVFNHHANDLQERLDEIQHAHFQEIVATTHVHADAHNCLEVIIMRGKSAQIQEIADRLLGTKGVRHGEFVITSIEETAQHEH
ncbi:MAG: nickel-responsive transcriptional regulator NikR [Coriobacteriaceae bacterium]|nr:nickel-responsive transcriptional regulator NikR [Coriobacteriaceae bacterium]